jgi:hypothetical protein
MEGTLRKRHSPPVVLRFFAPSRLADDVLAGVYERLLVVPDRLAAVNGVVKVVKDEDVLAGYSLDQLAATGGRYE